jgi:rhodanese-related sulfurtransferase
MELSNILSYVLYAILGWFLFTRFALIKGFKNLNAQDFESRLQQKDKGILLDVREKFEYDGGHIPNSLNIPLSQIKGRLNEIPKNQDVLLYCRSGMRSKQAGRILSKHGYNQLFNLQGGISSWKGKIAK